jgi:hypothetical protein
MNDIITYTSTHIRLDKIYSKIYAYKLNIRLAILTKDLTSFYNVYQIY